MTELATKQWVRDVLNSVVDEIGSTTGREARELCDLKTQITRENLDLMQRLLVVTKELHDLRVALQSRGSLGDVDLPDFIGNRDNMQ